MSKNKKRHITASDRVLLREQGISTLGISDFEKADEGIRARAIAAGAEGTRQKWDGVRIVKRARTLLAEYATRVSPTLPKRRSLRKWSLDQLLEGTTPAKRPAKVRFRDIDHEEDPSEVADLLELMAGADLGDELRRVDLAEIVDQEQDRIEATLAGMGEDWE